MPVSGRDHPPATSVPGPSGMIKIGRPVVRAMPLLLGFGVPACPLLAVPTAELFGDLTWRYLLSLACWLALLPGGITLFLVLWYRPVAFDPATGMARLGRKVVPLSTVTAARREVSATADATYVSYRFESTDGAWGRVLVAGRPMRGLSPEDLRHLERFVEASGIQEPTDVDGLAPARRSVAGRLNVLRILSTRSAVGKAALLAELRGEPVPEPAHTQVSPPTPEQWRRDDQDAEAYLADQPEVGRKARRFFGFVIAAAILAGLTAIIVAVILEQSSTSGQLDADTSEAVGVTLLVATAVGLAAYAGYCVASYFSIRHAQQVSLAWLRSRDAGQVERGLPLPLLAPFLGPPPGHKLKMLTAVAAGVIGGIGLLAAPIVYFAASAEDPGSDASSPGVAAILLAVGIAAIVLAVALFVNANRVKRRQHSFASRLGRRLYEGPDDWDGLDELDDPGLPDKRSRRVG